jgi:hypothetical protein
LRDQLKVGLSRAAPANAAQSNEAGTESIASVSELAEQIKGLKAAHAIEAVPERTAKRQTSAEEPVTARIRRRSEAAGTAGPAMEPDSGQSPAGTSRIPERTLQTRRTQPQMGR